MIQLVTSQAEADAAFHRWTEALLAGSTRSGYGWIIEGRNVVFSNYGHGAPGALDNEVMLGADPAYANGAVKIVHPDTAQRDKGKLTAIGRDAAGRRLLLRQGWLKRNNLSREVREDFADLTGLTPVAVNVAGVPSERQWFVVADLDAEPTAMLAQTGDFALACIRARNLAGGGSDEGAVDPEGDDAPPHSAGETATALAMDETGKIITVTRTAATTEVCALQGYVYQALKAILGGALTKPTKSGFAVDGVIAPAGLLLEIKTGVSPHDVYEAVGQLALYPALIGLDKGLASVLLIPEDPPLKPALAASLAGALVEIYTYDVTPDSTPPKITFSKAFLDRCGAGHEPENATARLA